MVFQIAPEESMYQRTVLSNGIRIVTEYIPHLHSVTLGAWFEVGSRHELPEEWGVSHFIEHLMFKGNKKYSAREIAEIMDNHGGYLNAFTGKEETCYYFKALDEDFTMAADVLGEMLLHSLFSYDDLIKEKNVVLEEIGMYEDSPEDLAHDLFEEAFWADHALGRRILGSPGSVGKFTKEQICLYLEKHYTTDRLVIASAGNIPHERVVKEFAERFSDLPRGQKHPLESPIKNGRRGLFHNKNLEQVHLCLGNSTFARNDKRRHMLNLLDTIIGGGVSSLLFQELREERGLVYNTYSFNSSYEDVGLCGIYAGFSPHNWSKVWDVICSLFSDLSKYIHEEMLQRAKGQLRGSLMLSLESTNNRMTRLARGELDEGRIITPEELLIEVEQVKYVDLMSLAAEIYNPKDWTWVSLGQQNYGGDPLCPKIC